jgi:hypothetical protein
MEERPVPVYLTQDAIQKLAFTTREARPTQKSGSQMTDMIELVLYINQDEHRFQRTKIEKELTSIFLKEDRVEVLRVLGEKRADGLQLGHLSALSIACESQRNVLILEDNFKFHVSREELQEHLRLVETTLGDRWNVIVFGHTASEWSPVEHKPTNNIQLMRIIQSGFECGYLVNRSTKPSGIVFSQPICG